MATTAQLRPRPWRATRVRIVPVLVLHALGRTHNQRLLHLTFTLRKDDTQIRVISARPMHRKERDIYAKVQQGPASIQDGS